MICLCYVENATCGADPLRDPAPAPKGARGVHPRDARRRNQQHGRLRKDSRLHDDIAIVKGSLRATVEKILAVASNPATEQSAPDLQPQMSGAVSSAA